MNCVRGTVGDAFARGAFPPATTLQQIQAATSGIRLGELAPFIDGVDLAALLSAIEASGKTVADLGSLDDMTLGDVATARSALAGVLLGELADAFDGLTFDDLANAIIDPATGEPVPGPSVLDEIRQAVSDWGNLADLEFLGDLTVGDLIGAGAELTLAEIEPVLGFVTVKALQDALGIRIDLGGQLLGQLSQDDLEFLTLQDLLALTGDLDLGDLLTRLDLDGALSGFTLGDLLLALVDPASLTYGGVEFAEVDVSALPEGTVAASTFSADFTMTASTSRTVQLDVALPTSAVFVPGSATVNGVASDPVLDGRTLTWTVPAVPGVTYVVEFDVLPSLRLGATSLNATARIVGTGVVVPASAQVTVAEGLEPNDFLPEVVDAFEDFVYLTYISSPDDYDVFAIDVFENDVLVAELSNLDADLDFALWGEVQPGTSSAALTGVSDEAAIIPITDPDASGDAQSGDDFPRLDEIVATSGLGLPELTLVATSNGPGTANEFLKSPRLAAGRYYVQVYGANGAVNVDPAALQLKVIEADTPPVCRDLPFLPGTEDALPGAAPSQADLAAANTLILLNESRLERLYGPAGRQTVVDAANSLVAYLSEPANSSLGIDAVVVPVDGYGSILDAYGEFDADSCVPARANDVVAEINRTIIDPLRDGNLEHIAILGGDELIPMARLEDATSVANEYDYRGEFDGDLVESFDANGDPVLFDDGRNALTAAAWDSMILSDEPYGDAAARSLGDRFLYTTDIALGRVVERPDEIAAALATFETYGGHLDIETAAVLGYDFLSDGSAVIADELEASELGAANVDRELAEGETADGRKWDKNDATNKLIAQGTRALVSLNAHFDHYRALPALGDKVPNFDDNLIATAVEGTLEDTLGARALDRSLIFSMGCHSGLSVSDIVIGRTNQDWAQTLGRQGSLYIGNTGFGYGDTETVAYTEQLMALFAEQVTSPFDLDPGVGSAPSTVGQALAWAKNQYVAEVQSFSVYDEKALMESTFYGLPFYRVGSPVGGVIQPQPLPAPPANTTVEDPDRGLETLTVVADDAVIINQPVDGDNGTYFRNLDADGNELVIVAPGRPIQPKTVTDISVVGTDTTELALVARGAVVTSMTSTYLDRNPVIATPVFDEGINQPEPDPLPSVFPLKPLQIVTTSGAAGTRQTLVQATGQYRGDTGVQRLDDDIETVVYYAPPGDTDVTAPTIAEVNSTVGGGKLTVSLKAGRAEEPDLVKRVVVLVAEDPAIDETIVMRSFDLQRRVGSNVWVGEFTLDPTTTVVEFRVQAVDQAGNVGYASNKTEGYPATVSPDPVVTGVVAPTAPAVRSAGVEVSVEFTDPTGVFDDYDVVFDWGDGSTSGALVDPPSSATDPGTATGRRTYEAPGRYDVTVTVTDAAGGTSTSSAQVVVYEPGAAPVITDVILAEIVAVGDTVDLSALFNDGSAGSGEDTFTAEIDWGDGSAPETASVVPPAFPQGSGSVSASHLYAQPGTFTVEVTVDDGTQTASLTGVVEVESPDTTPPTVTITAPADDATYTQSEVPAENFSCTDADSAVSTCEAVGYSTEFGEHTVSVTGESAGGTASASATYLVIPDPDDVATLERADPLADQLAGVSVEVSAGGFGPGETVEIFLYSSPVRLGAAIAGEDGRVTATEVIPPSTSLGTHSVVFVGRTSGVAKATEFEVIEVVPSTFSGFYSPVKMGEVNVVKAGRAVPIKFNVDQGGEVTDPSLISIFVYGIHCGWVEGMPQEAVAYSFSGGSELRWTGSEFHGNVKLEGRRGECRMLVAEMNDGSGSLAAVFRLK